MEHEPQKPIIREFSTPPPTPLPLQRAIFREKEIEDDVDADIYLGRLIAKEQEVIRKIQRLKEKKKVGTTIPRNNIQHIHYSHTPETSESRETVRTVATSSSSESISHLPASAAYTSLPSPPLPQPSLEFSRDSSSPSTSLIISKGYQPLTEYNSEYFSTAVAAADSRNDPYRNNGSVTAFHQQLPFPIKRPAEALAPSSVGQLNKQHLQNGTSSSLTFFDSINNYGAPHNTRGMNHGYGGTMMSASSSASSSAMYNRIINRFGGRDDVYSHYNNSGDGSSNNNRDYHRYSNPYFDRQPLPQSSVYSSRNPVGGIQSHRRNLAKSRIPPSSPNWLLPDRNRGRF
ncbi:10991_t:CDS:2 [Ambispora leptoticha]|uniref:10991_t:CDS:1 n=1 Tax=Ambispora leptoticha TaxID=144679 RepID=A0A9N8VDJ7_9GLOM|nr:10991_t:CDS:2 [Ambispora leptoticha]